MRAGKRPPKQSRTRVVGSMDVSALYPSCLVEPSKKKIKEAFRRSTLDFMSINRHKLCKYVVVNNKGMQLKHHLEQYLMTVNNRTTLYSYVNRP